MPLKHLRTPRRACLEHLGVAAERGRVGNCRFGQFLPSGRAHSKTERLVAAGIFTQVRLPGAKGVGGQQSSRSGAL